MEMGDGGGGGVALALPCFHSGLALVRAHWLHLGLTPNPFRIYFDHFVASSLSARCSVDLAHCLLRFHL